MHVHPQLEELEERSVLNAADLASFQQQILPSLVTQFQTFVPIVQSTLQTNLNHLEALAPLFPAPIQPLLGAVFAQQQQIVNAFPVLANMVFQQTVANFEAQLLAQPTVSPPPPPPVVVVRPAFFPFVPFFPFFLGGFGGGGVGFTTGFTSGFTSGFSSGFSGGFSGGSGSGSWDPPTVMGRGKGVGLMTTVGAMTLLQSNHP